MTKEYFIDLPFDKPTLSLVFSFILCLLLELSCTNPEPVKKDTNLPNILIAISDDQSYPYASAYGNSTVRTPAFDRVAEQGILFSNAFVASPGCAPSRSSILTGRYPWQNEEAGGHQTLYPLKFKVLPDVLEENGYHIGFTGKGCSPFNWRQSLRTRDPAGNAYNEIRYAEGETPADGINSINYAANFEQFLQQRPDGQPFYFWYGAFEPHRKYEEGSGIRAGKQISEAQVPGFLPDHEEMRKDILDYGLEIEWFDQHLMRMLELLENAGELDNTLVIVTSDNGMPFPRAKGNCYEYGVHVPMAVMWPGQIKPDRKVDDLISLADWAPTLFDITGLTPEGMLPFSASSIKDILLSDKSGVVEPSRDAIYTSRERHSSARWSNLGYPIRSIRTRDYLYIRNYYPERWPAGAPQTLDRDDPTKRRPMYDLDEDGVFGNQAFFDIDRGLAKTYLVENHDDPTVAPFFLLAMDKRPAEELFDIRNDPANLENLAQKEEYQDIKNQLSNRLTEFLVTTEDPREVGPTPNIFENYQRFYVVRPFPKPDWVK